MNPDLLKYCELMSEIKRRTTLVDQLAPRIRIVPDLEMVYLQFRKVTELVVFSSLIANKRVCETNYREYSKDWNITNIMKKIERINPAFYPVPIIQVPSHKPGVKMEFQPQTAKFLTKGELTRLYVKASEVLHVENPYRKVPVDLKEHVAEISAWRGKIHALLNSHTIQLLNEKRLYLIQMGALGQSPTFTVFARKDDQSNTPDDI